MLKEMGLRFFTALAAVVLMTTQPLLVKLSQVDGHTQYSTYIATLLSELAKAVVSLAMLFATVDMSTVEISPRYVLRYAVPGGVYFINNNLVFLIQERLDPATFQLVGQMKIVFTGLLFRFVLDRRLTKVQYLAIWQLACGAAVSQIPKTSAGAFRAEPSLQGFLLCMASCMLSALGGIYTEKLMKDKVQHSIHWQNLQLYSWGIAFNVVGTFIHAPDVLSSNSYFEGFNCWAVAAIANNTIMGLTIAAILKYADNIARVFAHAIAMLVTMILSVFLFGTPPTMQLVLAIAVVTASAFQYHVQVDAEVPPETLGLDAQRLALLEEASSQDAASCKPLVRHASRASEMELQDGSWQAPSRQSPAGSGL